MNAAKFTRASSFSIERFIEEVKKRPTIWDTKCNGYGDKNKKTHAWDEVCAIFIGGWQEMSPDERFVKARSLQRRWKSLRDCFRRELKLKSNSTNASTRRPYLFYKQLKFLQPVTDSKDFENAAEVSENDDTEDVKCFEGIYIEPTMVSPMPEELIAQKSPETPVKSLPLIPISYPSQVIHQQVNEITQGQTFENQLLGVLSKSIEMRVPNLMNTDEDQLFLLSLAGELRKVPEQKKLLLKSEIINCILRAQKGGLVNAEGSFN